MIHSYIRDNKFEKINRLLDQFCNRCNMLHPNDGCENCHLEHRKGNTSNPVIVLPDPEQRRLEVN